MWTRTLHVARNFVYYVVVLDMYTVTVTVRYPSRLYFFFFFFVMRVSFISPLPSVRSRWLDELL